MARAREELHAEAMRNKAAKEAAIKENCPELPDISAMAEGSCHSVCAIYSSIITHLGVSPITPSYMTIPSSLPLSSLRKHLHLVRLVKSVEVLNRYLPSPGSMLILHYQSKG